MRGVLHLCSQIGRTCYRGVVLAVHKRVRLIAVMLVLSLLIAALPASSGSARGTARAASAVSEESLPLQFYRSMRTTVAAIGMWMAESVRFKTAAAPPAASTYEPVTAHLSPEPPFIDAPTGLTVTAAADASLSLSWTAPAGSVDHYEIERSQSIEGPFLFRANAATTSFNDTSVTTDQAYLYRVRAVTSGGLPSTPSNMALGTATTFEFSGAALTSKLGKKQHIYDIRTAINAVRTVAGLSAATWTRSDLTGLVIVANDVQELRNRLGEALTVLDISVGAYTDPTFTAGVTVVKATHLDQLQVRSTRGSSNSSGPIDSDSSTARLDPLNETGGGGENPLSRNFNWNLPLVGLPGRAGMDLGLTLSYNSLVWTKVGSSVSFDDDYGFPGPGFRLGFPVIQQLAYLNSEVGKQAYLIVGTDGSRTELRQVSTSGAGATLWEAADSSHLLLDTTTTPFTLRASNGTQFRYELKGTEYQCTRVTDRNGNYITINYTATGRIAIDDIIDTLGRQIDFVYDANGWLTQIKQLWNAGAVTQYWAKFEYADTTIDTNFPSMAVYGPSDTTQIKTLSKVILPDNSYHQFSYTSWGQVWKITKYGPDNQPIKYSSYDLPQTGGTAHQDCPRFTARKDWAKYWNGDTDGTTATSEEVTTAFIVPVSDTWTMPDSTPLTGVRAQVTTSDGTINKIYFVGTAGTATGWSRGLPVLVDTVSGGVTQRRSVTTWTQDNTAVSYLLNPRVLETNVYDPAGNRARTQTEYQQFTFTNGTICWLPRDVFEYGSDATTKLRTTRTAYNTATDYTTRRILGLVSEKLLYQGDVNAATPVLMLKLQFVYDESAAFDGANAPIQHDSAYAGYFVGRANLTKVIRHNVSVSQSTSTSTKYNRAGSVISGKDAANHETTLSYADSFSDGNNARGTFAYPTTITDEDGFSTTTKFNFDFGAVTYRRTPQPNQPNNVAGPEQTFSYDSTGRLQQVTNLVNNAYTRVVYDINQLKVDTYTTIQEGLGEARSFEITDGAGRLIATAVEHPGSTGGYSGKRMVYDATGRLIKNSNPTETSASGTPFQWTATGDDAAAGWLYTEQTYDWKGRPLRTTQPDLTYSEAAYSGCGCAGGEVVTLTDEGTIDAGVEKRRQRKIYSDVLGRHVKTEMLNWAGGSVYSAVVNTYNVRDQVTEIKEYAGPEGSPNPQITSFAYDGYARKSSRHVPEQADGTATVWTYNDDDTLNSVTDARGAITAFSYSGNNRHLVTSVTHTLTGKPTITTSFTYDAVGNRMTMTDGMGQATYTHNALSQLTSETRTLTGVGSFTMSYGYNLTGRLTSVTDHFGAQVGYTYDKTGRVSAVTGSNFASLSSYASGLQYRAGGAIKALTYGNSKTLAMGYDANLNVSSYEVSGIMKKAYTYYNDGRLKFTQDQLITNSKFDRLYRYDHLGRTTVALSGLEAREQGTTNDRPYNETMTYDAFGHLTSREVRQWDRHDLSIDSYVNNRRTGWQYDADGRLLAGSNEFAYDAAGRIESFGFYDPDRTDQQFDGDGKRVKTVVKTYDTSTGQLLSQEVTYFVWSSVLGKVLNEVTATGAKQQGFVYAGGELLAIQYVSPLGGQLVQWQYYDASRASYRLVDVNGVSGEAAERDPFGADAGLIKPFTWPTPSGPGRIEPFYGIPDLNSATQGCVLDGIPVPCDMATSENSMQCPDNDCGPRTVYFYDADGKIIDKVLTNPFQAFTDGYDGFTFAGTSYVGDGVILNHWWSDTGGEKVDPDDFGFGTLLESLVMNFGPPQDRPKKSSSKKPAKKKSTTSLPKRASGPLGDVTTIPVPLNIDRLKELIQERLKYGDCAEYVTKLINQAASMPYQGNAPKAAESTDIMALFEKIKTQPKGGILFNEHHPRGEPNVPIRPGGGGWAWGSYVQGNAQMNVYTTGYYSDNPAGAVRIPYYYGVTGLHEVIHLSAKWGTYDEPHLTRAAQALEPNIVISDWDEALRRHCLPDDPRIR